MRMMEEEDEYTATLSLLIESEMMDIRFIIFMFPLKIIFISRFKGPSFHRYVTVKVTVCLGGCS